MIIVAFLDQGPGNDQEALGLTFHLHSFMHVVKLLQTWLIKTED